MTAYLQSVAGTYTGIIDDAGFDQSQYPASRGSSHVAPSHQASTDRLLWIVDARSYCRMPAARAVLEIDGRTCLVAPSDIRPHTCQRRMGRDFRFCRSQGCRIPRSAYPAYQTTDTACCAVHQLFRVRGFFFDVAQRPTGAQSRSTHIGPLVDPYICSTFLLYG